MKDRPLGCHSTSNLGTKSSSNFVSSLIQKNSNNEKHQKQKINYSKLIKPSITAFSKYLPKSHNSLDHTNDPSHHENIYKDPAQSSTSVLPKLLSENNTRILQKIKDLYESYQMSPLMQAINSYKSEKSQIIENSSSTKRETQEKIESLEKENSVLKQKLAARYESKTRDTSAYNSRIAARDEIVIEILEKHTEIKQNQELAFAIVAEFTSFKGIKGPKALRQIFLQITQFFAAEELQTFYPEITAAFCRLIIKEIQKKQQAFSESTKISHQFETLKAFETNATLNTFS